MKRRLFNLVTLLSLALCAATIATCAGGLRRPIIGGWSTTRDRMPEQARAQMDQSGTPNSEIHWMVKSERGRIQIERIRVAAGVE